MARIRTRRRGPPQPYLLSVPDPLGGRDQYRSSSSLRTDPVPDVGHPVHLTSSGGPAGSRNTRESKTVGPTIHTPTVVERAPITGGWSEPLAPGPSRTRLEYPQGSGPLWLS